MEEAAGWDWELLHNSDQTSIPSDSSETSKDFRGMEEEGIITSNYFSLDSDSRYAFTENLIEQGSVHSDNPSWVDPNLGFQTKNSSDFWSDSASDGSGSGSSNKFRDFEGKHELGIHRIEEIGDFQGKGEVGLGDFQGEDVGFQGIQGIGEFTRENVKFSDFSRKIGGLGEMSSAGGVGLEPAAMGEYASLKFEKLERTQGGIVDFDRFWADSGGKSLVQGKNEGVEGDNSAANFGEISNGSESAGSVVEAGGVELEPTEFAQKGSGELGSEKIESNGQVFSLDSAVDASVEGKTVGGEGGGNSDIGELGNGSESVDGVVEAEGRDELEAPELDEGGRGETIGETGKGEKKRIIWWKLPFEMLKFCVFRVSPVWSVSIAAAVMGFIILQRRLHKMKKKVRSIPLNVTVEDKKVSQFMVRAARLNEAFSVVRRVPIIRPSMPATGVTPWPVMSMR